MKKYNVIWFDDEESTLDLIREKAHLNGIILNGFSNAKDGIAELELNYLQYDAAIVDGNFFTSAEQSGTPVSDRAFVDVARAIDKLSGKKVLPWFILSGQKSFTKEVNTHADNYKNNKVYDKINDDDLIELWADIKLEADKQLDTQIRHEYQRVFDVCTEKYIGEIAAPELLSLLKINNDASIDNNLNTIRKITEDLFTAFSKYRLLPIEFVSPKVFLNESSRFLTGKNTDGGFFTEKGFQHLEETHLPPQISNNLRSIVSITQAGSHRSNIDLHIRLVRTPYLYRSVVFLLLDVIIWFKLYVDSKPKTENWIKIESNENPTAVSFNDSIIGKVLKIDPEKGFSFLKPDAFGDNIFIPPHLVTKHSLIEGMSIKVEVEEYVVNRTNETKTRVKRILN